MASEEPDTTIPATGWRFNPWGMRVVLLLAFAVGFSILYQILGAPATWGNAIPYLVVGAVVLLVLVDSELTTVRSVTVSETGVTLAFPLQRRLVTWERISVAPTQPRPVEGMVAFAEMDPKTAKTRLFRVTNAQATAIRARMELRRTTPT
jgi:hypothetical protein